LYDLQNDPSELDNLFRTNPKFAELAAGSAAAASAALKGAGPPQLKASGEANPVALKRVWDRLDAMVSGFYRCKVRIGLGG